MNPRRLRTGEWLTGIAGVVLLVSLFLDWYEAGGTGNSAWEAFSILDALLLIAALMAISVAVMAAVHNTPAVSLAIASLLLTLGAIATIAVVVRAISAPDVTLAGGVHAPEEDIGRSIGLWIGLAASSLVTLGSLASMRDERFPRGARIEVPVDTLPPPEGGKA